MRNLIKIPISLLLTGIEDNFESILPEIDAVVIVTGHDEFRQIELSKFNQMNNKILIDTRGIIEPKSAKDANLVFRGLGRGQ